MDPATASVTVKLWSLCRIYVFYNWYCHSHHKNYQPISSRSWYIYENDDVPQIEWGKSRATVIGYSTELYISNYPITNMVKTDT